MNRIKAIIISLSLLLGVVCNAQSTKKIIILNGYFFNEMPAAVTNNQFSQDMKLFTIQTPNGTRAVCIVAPSINLSDESLQYAIPVENVHEGGELLRRYNEQKDGEGISFTMGSSTPAIKIGDKFPEFTAKDIDGKTWTSADIIGKVAVFNLWFTGCGPCRQEMPELSTWKDEMPDVMFFSSTYEAPKIARQVLDKVNFNWIPLVNDTQFKEWIGGNGYPLTIIVDKSGNIVAFEHGTSPEQRASLKSKISEIR